MIKYVYLANDGLLCSMCLIWQQYQCRHTVEMMAVLTHTCICKIIIRNTVYVLSALKIHPYL